MKICTLTKTDLENVLDLFCECFSSDHYYQQLFAGCDNIPSAMRDAFRSSISFCLEKGISLGVIEDEKLIGFALLFDYKATKNTHRGAFNEIFGIHDDQPLPYYEEIHQKIESIDGKILYLLSIAVSPAYRRCGIASALIDYVLSYYSECSIASDVSNEDSLEIYKKRNFEISKIEDGYFFISKKHR